jgi:hypothetical protein
MGLPILSEKVTSNGFTLDTRRWLHSQQAPRLTLKTHCQCVLAVAVRDCEHGDGFNVLPAEGDPQRPGA